MPSVVAVLAGNTVGNLKELKQSTIPSSCQEFVLLNALTEVCYNPQWLATLVLWLATLMSPSHFFSKSSSSVTLRDVNMFSDFKGC